MQLQDSTEQMILDVAGLPALNKSELLEVWNRTFPSPPPAKLRKELMVPILAYRMQEALHGGLSHAARRRLQQLMDQRTIGFSRPARQPPPAKALSKLVRSWHGEIHEVLITEDGYRYRGQVFRTLSPIAKLITGTQWSGPAFFGTRTAEKKR